MITIPFITLMKRCRSPNMNAFSIFSNMSDTNYKKRFNKLIKSHFAPNEFVHRVDRLKFASHRALIKSETGFYTSTWKRRQMSEFVVKEKNSLRNLIKEFDILKITFTTLSGLYFRALWVSRTFPISIIFCWNAQDFILTIVELTSILTKDNCG